MANEKCLKNLLFPRRKRMEFFPDLAHCCVMLSGRRKMVQRGGNSCQKRLAIERLFDKVDRAGFHCFNSKWYISMSRHDNDGHLHGKGLQATLQLESIDFCHTEIRDDAAGLDAGNGI